MSKLPKNTGPLAVAVLALAGSAAHAAINAAELASVGGDQGQLLFGTGRGVSIGVLDQGIDSTHPALRGSIRLAKDFTGAGTIDDDNRTAGHGTGIAGILVGHGVGYSGLAPSAKIINARIVTYNDNTTDRTAGNGMFYAIRNGAQIISLSIGAPPSQGPTTEQLNLMIDYAADRFGTSVVSAAGNEATSAVNYSPGGAYNGYSVGALNPGRFVQVSGFSNFATPGDLRSKPDLVAPGASINVATSNWEHSASYIRADGTSFSTPMVGGVLAQMIGYGKAHHLSTSPTLLKAILLTSADKVWDYSGTPWQARKSTLVKGQGTTVTQPLDSDQGAGRLDAVTAYGIYAKKATSSQPISKWATTKLAQKKTYSLSLGSLKVGMRVDATLAWLRHVTLVDRNKDGVADGGDLFKQSKPLANFKLILLRNGKPVLTSDSNVDNLEHLSFKITQAGNYTLKAYRYADGGLASESFSIATRVLANAPLLQSLYNPQVRTDRPYVATGVTQSLSVASGVDAIESPTFDATRPVEQADIPELSTTALAAGGSPMLVSTAAIAAPLSAMSIESASFTAVPEPSTLWVLVVSGTMMLGRRRRKP